MDLANKPVVERRRFASMPVLIRAMLHIHARRLLHVKQRHSLLVHVNTKSKLSNVWQANLLLGTKKRLLIAMMNV